MIEFDVETTSLATHGENPAEVFLAQFLGESDEVDLNYRDGRGVEPATADIRIQEWLDQDEDFRAWNSKFDLRALHKAGFRLPPPEKRHDGMVAAHIVDERRSAALQARGDALFGPAEAEAETEQAVKQAIQELNKERRKRSKETGEQFVSANYGDVDRSIMDPYAAHDPSLQRKVCDVYYPQIASNPAFQNLYDMEMGVMNALFDAEIRGIPFDREALVSAEAAMLPKIEELEDAAIDASGFKGFNPRSPKQIGEALERQQKDAGVYSQTGLPKVKLERSNGNVITDEEHLSAYDLPLGNAILAYRGEEKMYSWLHGVLHGPTGAEGEKFPGAYLDSDDLVHPNFRQLGARTGRMSCSNPNFQNMPRDDLRIRYAVAAQPGKKLVTCDLSNIELVLLGLLAGEGTIYNTVREGGDLHQITAERVGLTGRKRSSGAFESPRDQGKRLNYLIVYGGGVKAIMRFFGVDRERAGKILDAMHRAYPEVTSLQARIDAKLEDRGYVESPLSLRRYRMYGSGYNAVQKEGYKFLNYLIQGTAADILKIALVSCWKKGLPIVAAVHDELIAHCDESDAVEVAHEIQESMTHGFTLLKDGRNIEDLVPITAEPDIVDRWSQAKKKEYVPDYV